MPLNRRELVVDWGITFGKNEHVEEAESESSTEEKMDEASVFENGDVEDRVGLEFELIFRGTCAERGHIDPVRLYRVMILLTQEWVTLSSKKWVKKTRVFTPNNRPIWLIL